MKVWPGTPYPLGATFDGIGTNFSIFSEVAERIELCLFDENGKESRFDLPEVAAFCWHGFFPEIVPGQRYGYRVHGPYNPQEGNRCNPSKLLIDPYAKAIAGQVEWNKALFPYLLGEPEDTVNNMDSAPFVPKCVVMNPFFDWSKDQSPQRTLSETIIYEMNIKGFTARHPDIPPEIRGTYAGIIHPVSIEYLTKLGITAIELLPVHQFVHNNYLLNRGLRDYWGYNSIGYFCPHNEYSSRGQLGQQVQDFKQMVKILHEAGIEVILDVVYNHTAEGNHLGPILAFKGIDNVAYYRLNPEDRRHYWDYTGTGNTLNMRHPHVLQLIMDSLRYWVTEMHVDGFRFDLASTLARTLKDVDRLSAFFDLVQQDPVVSQVKLIAEPWDVGEGGYQVGYFPPQWSEWNGKYRDCVRTFWRGNDQTLGEFAYRITGSSDLYGSTGRQPYASINFVTAHDGFTLQDLVSYDKKHNEANGEDNHDGTDDNRSWNCGVEGPTEDHEVNNLRMQQKRNFLATLFLSQGVPMLLGGDEMGRTQQGNNNGYCQDNEISWFNWDIQDHDLLEFTQKLIHFRKEHPVFRRRKWFQGRAIHGSGVTDIAWFTSEGLAMDEQHWGEESYNCLEVFLNGKAIPNPLERGDPILDDTFLMLFNANPDPVTFTLPPGEWGELWIKILDTAKGWSDTEEETIACNGQVIVNARSMSLFILRKDGKGPGKRLKKSKDST